MARPTETMFENVNPEDWENRTPHPIRLYGPSDGPDRDTVLLEIPRTGEPLRFSTYFVNGYMYAEKPRRNSPGACECGGCDRSPRQVIVSLPFAMAHHGPARLWVPADEVRNEEGTVIGCRKLALFRWTIA